MAETQTRIYRSRSDRMVAGVAGGLGPYLGVDPVIVRLGIVALAFAGVGVLAYLIAWIIIPEEDVGSEPPATPRSTSSSQNARIIAGVIMIAVGSMLLLDRVIPSIDRFFWPVALIGLGIGLFVYGSRK